MTPAALSVDLGDGRTLAIPDVPGLAQWSYWKEVFATRPARSWTNRAKSFTVALDRLRALGVRSLVETCGGIGVFSWMAQDLLAPASHVIIDVAPESALVTRALVPSARSVTGDAAAVVEAYVDAATDAVFVDYPVFTLYRAAAIPGWESVLFHKLLRIRPKTLLITDSAVSRLHLQRARYQSVFGVPLASAQDYYNLYERYPAPGGKPGSSGYVLDASWRFTTIGGGGTLILLRRGPS